MISKSSKFMILCRAVAAVHSLSPPGPLMRVLLTDEGELEWLTMEDGQEVRFDHEPETSWWKRFSTHFLSIFVPESQL